MGPEISNNHHPQSVETKTQPFVMIPTPQLPGDVEQSMAAKNCRLNENSSSTENGGCIVDQPQQLHGESRKRKIDDETAAYLRWLEMRHASMETVCNKLVLTVKDGEQQFKELAQRVETEVDRRDHIMISYLVSSLEKITGQKIHLPQWNSKFISMNNNNIASTTAADPHFYNNQPTTSVQHQHCHDVVITAPYVNTLNPTVPPQSPAEPTRWVEEELHALIEIRSSMEPKFNEPTSSKSAIWEEISKKMLANGYVGRSGKGCREKWENCLKYYGKHKEEDKAATAAASDDINGGVGGGLGFQPARKRARHSRTKTYFKLLDVLFHAEHGLLFVNTG